MITSHERVRLNEVSYEAKYSDMPTFKFFVIANAIVCIYCLLVLCLPSKSLLWGLIVALDMVLDVTYFKHFGCFSNWSSGKEWEFVGRLVTSLRPSPQVLWSNYRRFSCFLHWSHYLYVADSLRHPQCPRSSYCSQVLRFLCHFGHSFCWFYYICFSFFHGVYSCKR